MNEKDVLEFAKITGKLKRTIRTGWKQSKIKNPESVADHSFRATILGMVLSDSEKLNTERIMRMLLLHDIEESVSGDITTIYKSKMNKTYLREKQTKAIKKVLSPLPKDLRDKYLSIWREMEEGKTLEAKYCKDIDKLEMMIQALEYERENKTNKKKLDAFWLRKDINAPYRIETITRIYEKLRKERGIEK